MLKKFLAGAFALCLSLANFQGAYAGAPLKGIDVKLGKNPGGGCAAKGTTDDTGHVNAWFTSDGKPLALIPKGNYIISVSSPSGRSSLHIVIDGTEKGHFESDINVSANGNAVSRTSQTTPLAISMDGRTPLNLTISSNGTVDDAKVKSRM